MHQHSYDPRVSMSDIEGGRSGFMRTIEPFCTVQLGLASGQRVADGDAFVFVLQGADMSCMCRLQWYYYVVSQVMAS